MSANFARFTEFGRKIVAVGRNYRDHALELGNPVPSEPVLFMKPPTAYILEGSSIKIPKGCDNLHHEIELGVVIGRKGADIKESNAMDHVSGYVLALDMTNRSAQNIAKKEGLPWDISKGFDTSCPVSSFVPKTSIINPQNVDLWCKVNGVLKQKGNTKDMIFSIPFLVSYISQYFTLEPNDLILTGTPSGVGPVTDGDSIEGGLGDVVKINFKVQSK